jgi:hypothetical protein
MPSTAIAAVVASTLGWSSGEGVRLPTAAPDERLRVVPHERSMSQIAPSAVTASVAWHGSPSGGAG